MWRLFNRYWSIPATVSVLIETGLLFLSVLLAFRLRFADPIGQIIEDQTFWIRGAVVTAVVIICFYLNGLYDFGEHLGKRELGIRILRSCTFSILALWAVYYIFPFLFMGRGVLALAFIFSGVLLTSWRFFIVWVLGRHLFDFFNERILIVGADDAGKGIAREIIAREHLGYRVVGFVDDDEALQGQSMVNPRVIGSTNQTCDLALSLGATRVVVAQKDHRGKLSMDALLECKTKGIHVESGADYFERLTGKIDMDGLRVKSWLVFSKGFVVSSAALLWKRILDVCLAALGLVTAAPVMAIVAIAIRLESRGEVLFRQERVGKDGRIFNLIKFRSMHSNAEEVSGPVWATNSDPRITRLGRWARKWRIDELPQFWNVLVGDMSLVGPRPERQVFVDELMRLNPMYRQRFVVRPGLTGWAQINAPYAATVAESLEKLRYDLYYIKNLSVFLDISILASTIRTVLVGRGAQ